MVCGIMVKEHTPTLIMCSEAEYVCNMGRGVCVCIKYSYNGCDIVCYTEYITHAHAHFELCFYALVDKLFSIGHAQNAI